MATILDYLERKANILRRSLPNVFIECPGCGTRKAKCSIHVNKAIGNCFRASCSLHGGFSFPTLISTIENVPFSEALSIAARFNEEVDKEFQAKSYGLNRDYPINSLPLQELLNKGEADSNKLLYFLAKHGTDYLVQKRNLTYEQIENYKLGVGFEDFKINEEPILRYGYVIVPIFFNGEIVSYYGRSIEVSNHLLGSQKHIHADSSEDYLTIGQVMFNCDVAFRYGREVGYLVLVEDAWSAIKLKCLATLGSNLSDDQIYILVNNWKKEYGPIVICRDNDKGGNKAAYIDAKKLFKHYDDVRIAKPLGVDPDDHLEETKSIIAACPPIKAFEFQLSHLLK